MINLLTETLEEIEANNLKVEDIVYIGTSDGKYSCSWEEFKVLADKRYDNGYGGAEVNPALIIVFKGGEELHREEYDGSEWWDLWKPFKVPCSTEPLTEVFGLF